MTTQIRSESFLISSSLLIIKPYLVFGFGEKYDKVSGNHTGEDIGAPIGWGSAGDTGVTGGMGTTGDITGDVSKYIQILIMLKLGV